MTAHPAKRELDTYLCKRPLCDISVRQARVADIAHLLERAQAEIGSRLANLEHISRILDHNGECIWVVERAIEGRGRRLAGFHAFLPLSAEGEAALLCASFAFTQPALHHVVRPGEAPAALYWWASLGPGITATAITLVMQRLLTPRYRYLDIYSRPATRHGARALLNVGFRPLFGGEPVGSLHIYRRLANRTAGSRLN